MRKSKEHGFGTFYWMTLTDGFARSVPAFSEPELARTIVEAWHGEGYNAVFPSMDEIDFKYSVTFNSQWSEMNLYEGDFSLDEYAGVRFSLDEAPEAGELHVKVYGESEGKEQFGPVQGKDVTVMFDPSEVGSECSRVTLQYTRNTSCQATVSDVAMICPDGSVRKVIPSVFWGCYMEPISL